MSHTRIITTLAIAAMLSPLGAALHAQNATSAPARTPTAGHVRHDPFAGLNLTATQRTRIKAIRQEYPGKEQAKARRQAIAATLTADQRTQFKKNKKAWHQHHHRAKST